MARVFISNKSDDEPAARRLAIALFRAGYDPWFPEDEILSGESALDLVERGLADADFAIICSSQSAIVSHWFETHSREGVWREYLRQPDHARIARFDDVPLPTSFSHFQAFDLFPEERWDAGVAQLLTALQSSEEIHTPSPGPGQAQLRQAINLARRPGVAFDAVEQAYRDAQTVATGLRDHANAARAAFLLGDRLARRGGWESARQANEQGLGAARLAGISWLEADGYRLVADACLHGESYEDARLNYQEAIRRFDRLERHRQAMRTRLLYVTLLLQLGRDRDASADIDWLRRHGERAVTTAVERSDLDRVLTLANRAQTGAQ